uniref:Uncharacterized protein n=1 Tax=Arundo donax TaxID=35708 RepID=A0A0A9HBD9_ARUDO
MVGHIVCSPSILIVKSGNMHTVSISLITQKLQMYFLSVDLTYFPKLFSFLSFHLVTPVKKIVFVKVQYGLTYLQILTEISKTTK